MIKVKSKKVNPDKSNKMIYAVIGGLVVVFLTYLLFFTLEKKPRSLAERLEKSLAYLKSAPGIISVRTLPLENKVEIIYDSNSEGDFPRVAHFAAVRLLGVLDNFTLILAKNSSNQPELRIIADRGRIIREEKISP